MTETKRPLILIIDDTPANLMVLGAALERDYDLRVASSGADGLRLAASLRPDLILLDIMMPEVDGHEVCRRLKADPVLGPIPVIFITALGESDSEVDGLALGAADYLTKPVNVAIALQRIRNLLQAEALRKQVEVMALEAAGELATLRLEFMRNVSHELRTPLNSILGLAMLGARATDLAKAQQQFKRIHDIATEYLAALETVLNFGEAQASRLEVTRVPFDLGLLLDELVFEYDQRAAAKGLQLVAEDLPPPGAWVSGDPRWLREVLQQLLDNAVKFTSQGQVGFAAQRDGEVVRFSIRDSGIGMSEDELRHAFMPFRQADGSMTRRFGGMGLALALVDLLVGRMGGSINARSEPGKGTCFDLSLPLPETAPGP